jgi:hypothetical protein
MKGGVGLSLVGMVALLALASCGRSFMHTGEREAWRHQAEETCLKSGEVKLGAGVVQISPIEGPGICGADFPLKVSVLGESQALGYGDDLRPPGAIPNGSSAQMPNWPPSDPYYSRPAPPPQPVQSQPMQARPASGEVLRWTPGPPGIDQSQQRYVPQEQPRYAPPIEQPRYVPSAQDRYAPPIEDQRYIPSEQDRYAPSYQPPPQRAYEPPQRAYEPPPQRGPAGPPMSINAPGVQQQRDDIPDDAILPQGRTPASYPRNTYNAPSYEPPPQPRALPSLGPMRGPQSAAITPATLTPAATLACPLVSSLDRWVSESVQPAALRWFGAPVTEIKQISAYSCRSMVGAGTSHISEHAFGNALDIAGFVLADGRKIIVRDGWHGSPEEQGFLRDVHMAACDYFSTVLAPGYNAAHYDHIHVDLMRRASGRHPCRPEPISGDMAAAKARTMLASHRRGPAYTGSTALKWAKSVLGIPGEDGEFDDDEVDAKGGWPIPTVPAPKIAAPATTDITGSIPSAPSAPPRPQSTGDANIRLQEMRDAAH